MAANEPTSGHYRTLFLAFVLSKAVLVAIAAGSQVGPTYDTSTSLLSLSLNTNASSSAIRNAVAGARPDDHLLTRLTSWDAVYFLKAAERGYLFEQEWAFGSALPMCISLLHRALTPLGITNPSLVDPAHVLPLLGVAITNTCHFLSSLVLYQLGVRVCADATWALVAALLHLFSPAGMFLVAPFQESPFALLSFLGWWLLVKSCYCSSAKSHSSSSSSTSYSLSQDVLTLLAGVSFGLATLFRSNGLLNGIPLALDFLRTLYNLVEDVGPTPGGSGSAVAASTTAAHARRLVVLGLSGMTAAAGSLVPQVLAYRMYCTGAGAAGSTNVRPWCVKLVPSIYNFVQQHYWNTGLFRYWTFSNLPLFLLAAPMLFVMTKSGKDMFFQAPKLAATAAARQQQQQQQPNVKSEPNPNKNTTPQQQNQQPDTSQQTQLSLLIKSMALAQLLIAFLTFTSYHVQIITRLSSGYPAWYWWVAACLRSPKTQRMGKGIVVFSVMYACIQGVLFTSFLPPA